MGLVGVIKIYWCSKCTTSASGPDFQVILNNFPLLCFSILSVFQLEQEPILPFSLKLQVNRKER